MTTYLGINVLRVFLTLKCYKVQVGCLVILVEASINYDPNIHEYQKKIKIIIIIM